MNKTEIDRITNKMLVIKGQPLNEIVRTSSMLCLGFGDKVKGKTAYKTDEGAFKVKESEKSKYALHIDCFFRISAGDKILLTRDDMFKASSKMQDNDFDEEEFQWDIKDNNRFDEELTTVLDPENQLLSVKEIHVNIFGDLKVILSNNYCIETFTDTSEEEECWRFFEMGNTEAPHIVVKGSSIFEE